MEADPAIQSSAGEVVSQRDDWRAWADVKLSFAMFTILRNALTSDQTLSIYKNQNKASLFEYKALRLVRV